MKRPYKIAKKSDTREIADYPARHGEQPGAMVEPIEGSRMAVDELTGRLGRAHIEAVPLLSAQGLAGEKRQGK